ncbi:DUF4238 domain-containing protein [Pseudomonas sp. EL_65y_Pfl1_R32]|uniref:DUF4238 domain-containing protein n=1 Tax=Pseudomonas sp. EL_65y_Pfl1_R32 TaxID=3088696 RepID=UPI0030DA35CE
MATNKNQHYVPRCYFRPFTLGGQNASISIYNIDRHKFIKAAPVKNQCSGDYFYGKDEQLEAAIQSVEQAYGQVLQCVLASNTKVSSEYLDVLKIFWVFQYVRTEGASRRSAQMFDETFSAVRENIDFSLEIKEAVQAAMRTFAESMHLVSDLKVCLIRNATKVPFVTSDDPAILTNRWQLEDKRTRAGALGLKQAGAILLLPLSPKIMCIAYDTSVYTVANTEGWLTVRKPGDIEVLNQFQLLNCRANIFIGDEAYAPELDNFVKRFEHRRLATRHRVTYAVFDGEQVGNHKRYRVVPPSEFPLFDDGIMHAETVSPIPSAWPSFLQRRNKGYAFYNGTGAGYVRSVHAVPVSDDRPFIKVSVYR